MVAIAGLAPSRKLSERLFGYDVFVSFALGEPPRGNFFYASDLARRLQDAGLVVFFSEVELGYEDTLSASIQKALVNTKVLVVITNAEVLKHPRWIQTEVQLFRKHHPQRPIIPISLDGCLQAALAEKGVVDNWHDFEKRKFIVESFDGGASDNASLQTLNSIVASVGRLRANKKWRALVVSVVLLLLVLTVVSWRMKFAADDARDEALHKQYAANMMVVGAEQTNGEFLQAADRAAKSNEFPKYFQENVQQAMFQRAVLLDTQGGSSISSMKFFDDGVSSNVVLGSRYGGIGVLPLNGKQELYGCDGLEREFSNAAVSSDRFFWVGYDLGTAEHGSAIVRRWPSCEALSPGPSRWEEMLSQARSNAALQTLVPLPNQRLLVGWLDGRLQIYTASANRISLPVKPFPLAAVWADSEGDNIAVLDRGNQLRLFDLDGKTMGLPLKLAIGKPERTTSKAWLSFFGDLAEGKAKVLKAQVNDKAGIKDLVLIVVPDPTGAVMLLDYFATETDPLLDAVSVRDEVSGCDYAYYLTATRLARVVLHDRCLVEDEKRRVEIEYPRASTEYPAGAFCENGGFVVGDWDGNVYWMRYVRNFFDESSVEIEHVEHSWPDAVSGVVCSDSGAAYVSFRSNGVKLFQSSWRLQTREINRGLVPVTLGDWPEADVTWKLETFHGPAVLYLRHDRGDMELISQEQLVWRKNFARPREYETGNFTDVIQSVVVDDVRNRFWVLTSFGRLSLVEMNTGSILARFGTNFFSAAPAIPSGFDKLTLSDQGGVSFSYALDGKVIEVAVTPRIE
ncbi:hypothetical protein PS662_05423 [Pseudomonas fluorescens]|uniref:TIR domain-containing protein n=1 Tax=Pseudomonas fluorescens TaxID=294 RepID=A0A5E6XFB9_PSEFL|nr:toll/interleukin-1 receptor domain-containing protein [Pseudomonas fluorescens]VVN40322.1 hypothetical protein PS662_05423 [Pseudomonas fluorescens]